MADNKKYYYMRLKENFFDSDEMIVLEGLPEGYIYSNILLKLYLKSLKNNGYLMLNECIPYDANMISKILKQPIGIVKDALSAFVALGLIDVLDDGTIYMSNIELFIGQSSTEGERKKAARLRNSGRLGQLSDKRPPEIEIDIEKDKYTDIESEEETEIEKETTTTNNDIILCLGKNGNVKLSVTQQRELIHKYGSELVYPMITRLDDYIQTKGVRYSNQFETIQKWIEEDNTRIERDNGCV